MRRKLDGDHEKPYILCTNSQHCHLTHERDRSQWLFGATVRCKTQWGCENLLDLISKRCNLAELMDASNFKIPMLTMTNQMIPLQDGNVSHKGKNTILILNI